MTRFAGLKQVIEAYADAYPDGADHTLVWLDGDRYIVSTEPYTTARLAALEVWCTAHGWDWLAATNLGMWNPPHTILYLLSPPKNGGDLERFRRKRFLSGGSGLRSSGP